MTDTAPDQDLADQNQKKQEEVLEREGLEQELMQDDESEAGERIEGVDDDG